MDLDKLDLLEDIIFRYRRHLRILKVLNSTGDDCLPREELELWEAQIHHEFQTRLEDAVVCASSGDKNERKEEMLSGDRDLCKL